MTQEERLPASGPKCIPITGTPTNPNPAFTDSSGHPITEIPSGQTFTVTAAVSSSAPCTNGPTWGTSCNPATPTPAPPLPGAISDKMPKRSIVETEAVRGETPNAMAGDTMQGLTATSPCQEQVVSEATQVHITATEDVFLNTVRTQDAFSLSVTDTKKVQSTQIAFAKQFKVTATGQDMLYTVTISDSQGGNKSSNTIRIKHQ